MDIQQKQDNGKGKFFIEADSKIVAEMTYVWAGNDTILIDHTEVDSALKGQGIGKLLVEKAVEFARIKGVKIIPVCSFAKHVLENNQEFKDVLQTH